MAPNIPGTPVEVFSHPNKALAMILRSISSDITHKKFPDLFAEKVILDRLQNIFKKTFKEGIACPQEGKKKRQISIDFIDATYRFYQ
ncbi:hypothetical protein LJC15_03825 [Desulfovibrio sp. OttesenSCG-928-G11]|nr:hypothetical protein [Desulfovibrio sp. OttesenSCG-928-G11]